MHRWDGTKVEKGEGFGSWDVVDVRECFGEW